MKDKQIASIFNILQKNNMIDIDQFLQYIKKKRDQGKQLQNKNKKNENKKIELTDIEKLKGILRNILNNRKDPSKPIFHSFQFSKLERDLKKNRGQLLQLFKEIDKNRRGSFGFNQLIQHYIDKTKDKDPDQILYAYQLMGVKLSVDKEKPEDVLERYNGGPGYKRMSIDNFKKFMLKQFSVIQSDAEVIFRSLANKDNQLPIKKIIEAMKLPESQKKTYFIKPTLWNTYAKDFFRKNCSTILFNPFIALRFCLTISEQLKKIDQTNWDDFEFGPTFQDPLGSQSIGFESVTADSVKWLTVQSLGMKQFYENQDKNMSDYLSSNQCPHDKFPKILSQLVRNNELQLESTEKPDYRVKKVEDEHLRHLFDGLYPIVFRPFASFGIYVFRFYSRQKWVYVIIDNKIPCNTSNEPMFSQAFSKKHSWISLVEKAYAKLRGNYLKLFTVNSNSLYIHQLNRKIPIKHKIPLQLSTPEQKNTLWNHLQYLLSCKQQGKVYSIVSDSQVSRLIQNKIETGLLTNYLYQIITTMQIMDEKSQNQHKSHRLILMKADVKNDKVWNSSWNSGEDMNKYDSFYDKIQEEVKKKDISTAILKYKNVNILNYKLFRNIFNQLFALKGFSYQNTIILRKIVQFQSKFVCRYELNSKIPNNKPIKLFVTLNRIRGPADTTVNLTLSQQSPNQKTPNTALQTYEMSNFFQAFEFSIGPQLHSLQINVKNWHENQDHIYTLTFYIDNPMYHLRELDRQNLFKYLAKVDECAYLNAGDADEKERLYLYRNYFKSAERGNGCCG